MDFFYVFDSSTCMVFGKHIWVPAASIVKVFDEAAEVWAYNLILPPAICKPMNCLNMVNPTETKDPINIVQEFVC